jgi:hypothetical protein
VRRPPQQKHDFQEKFVMNEQLAARHESLNEFYDGLEGKIGDPDTTMTMEQCVEDEHCHRDDSKSEFGSSHYEITTTSHAEWRLVFHPDTMIEGALAGSWAKERTILPNGARTAAARDGAPAATHAQFAAARRRARRRGRGALRAIVHWPE